MSTIVTRAGKGSALTHTEVDNNFINLNTDKIEAAQSVTLTNKTISGANNTLSSIGNSSLTNSSVTIGSTSVSLGSTATTVSGLTLSSPTVSGGTINDASVGATTPSTGAFTTLSASSTVSGTGFSTYLASPPAIGGTAAAAGSFTTLSASSTVSGTGFSTYLASPPAIGGTAAAAGSFTTLSATGVATFQAGSNSAPAITTSGDTNTGVFFPAADTVAIGTGGTEALRVNSSQNVGIGTTSPASKLHVTGLMRICDASAYLLFRNAADSTSNGVVQFPDSGEASIVNYRNTDLTFGTNNNTRARIAADGKVSIGGSTENGVKLQVIGEGATNGTFSIYCRDSGNTARFAAGNGGTLYATSTTISSISDQRLKENIVDLDVGLAEIMALQPRKFDWKEGQGKDIKGDRGFIAQEVEAVFPELIDEWIESAPEGEEPYKSVRQDLIPVLVKAIQELKAIVDAQAAKIAALENA